MHGIADWDQSHRDWRNTNPDKKDVQSAPSTVTATANVVATTSAQGPIATESTSRRAFITTIVSILLSPLSVVLGFYLNHILQKPDLRIDLVDQEIIVENHVIPEKLVSKLAADHILSEQLRESITRLEQTMPPQFVSWIDGEKWNDDCITVVNTGAQGVLSIISTTDVSRVPGPLVVTVPSKDELKSATVELQELIQWLSSISKNDETPKTGDMCFTANVINSGDYDGVLLRKGLLKFSSKEMALFADKYVVVKAHGYEQIKYCTATAIDSDSKTLGEWRAIVQSGKNSKYKIVVTPSEHKPLEFESSLQ